MTYRLGTEIIHNRKTYLVVGIIDAEHLFETDQGREVREEKYVCLRSATGDLEFITLTERWFPCEEEQSSSGIAALPRVPWRRE